MVRIELKLMKMKHQQVNASLIASNLMWLRLLCLDVQSCELHNGNLNYCDPSINKRCIMARRGRGGKGERRRGGKEMRRGGEEERRRGGEEERRRGGEEERRKGGEEEWRRGGDEERRGGGEG